MNNTEREATSIKTAIKSEKGSVSPKAALGAAAGAVVLGGAILGASGAFKGEQSVSTPPPPDHTAAASSPTPPDKTVIPTPTGSVEVSISPSPSPEVAKVPCTILSPEICAQGEFIIYNNGTQEIKYIAWKDIPVGTDLRSFIDGQRTVIPKITSSTSPFQGASGLSISTLDHNTTATFIGNITIPDNPIVNNGQTVGSIAEQKVKIFGQYDLIFTADEKTLNLLFGTKISTDIPKRFSSTTGSPGVIITNPNYSNKP